MSRHFYLFLITLVTLLLCPLLYTFGEEKESAEDTKEEQEVDRSIAQEEAAYQKDVPLEEEELAPQAPHDMDDTHLLSKHPKSQY